MESIIKWHSGAPLRKDHFLAVVKYPHGKCRTEICYLENSNGTFIKGITPLEVLLWAEIPNPITGEN